MKKILPLLLLSAALLWNCSESTRDMTFREYQEMKSERSEKFVKLLDSVHYIAKMNLLNQNISWSDDKYNEEYERLLRNDFRDDFMSIAGLNFDDADLLYTAVENYGGDTGKYFSKTVGDLIKEAKEIAKGDQ